MSGEEKKKKKGGGGPIGMTKGKQGERSKPTPFLRYSKKKEEGKRKKRPLNRVFPGLMQGKKKREKKTEVKQKEGERRGEEGTILPRLIEEKERKGKKNQSAALVEKGEREQGKKENFAEGVPLSFSKKRKGGRRERGKSTRGFTSGGFSILPFFQKGRGEGGWSGKPGGKGERFFFGITRGAHFRLKEGEKKVRR